MNNGYWQDTLIIHHGDHNWKKTYMQGGLFVRISAFGFSDTIKQQNALKCWKTAGGITKPYQKKVQSEKALNYMSEKQPA